MPHNSTTAKQGVRNQVQTMKPKHALFIAAMAVVIGVFWKPLWTLITLSIHQDEYSHIILIPVISICLIYWRRAAVFAKSVFPTYAGAIPLLTGFALYGVAARVAGASAQSDVSWVSLSTVGVIFASAGLFLFVYGWPAARASLFPLGFLLFAVPLPPIMLAKMIYWLQQGSSDVAAMLLGAVGVPFLREGLIFHLPGVTIEVAPECSGIRSSTALLITTLLASQFLLRSNWKKLVLCLLVLPLAMFKNGLRIATLSVLSVYVSRDFLYGWLHRSGGFVFFLIGLTFILLALKALQRGDGRFALDKTAAVRPSQAEV